MIAQRIVTWKLAFEPEEREEVTVLLLSRASEAWREDARVMATRIMESLTTGQALWPSEVEELRVWVIRECKRRDQTDEIAAWKGPLGDVARALNEAMLHVR